jgi:hypothetical protein|tara:strand:+ start:269 stop:883 length:615 start_codon:yes stop_codon:yes gene_type:complete
MSKKVLLREYYELCEGGICQDLLTEAEKKMVANGTVMLSGIMQKADALNGNGRVYPLKVLQKEVKNYQKLVNERRALGELDHPDESVINLKNASHLVTKLWWDGDNVMGKVQVLNTPSGNILKGLVESNVKLGISSRGLGTTDEKSGKTYVNDDFQLICFDFVSEPSTPGAYMMSEGVEKSLNTIFTKADRINRALNNILEGVE